MKEKKIDLVITIAEIGAIANLAKAFEDVDYFPKVPFYGAQAYGQKFIQLAGAGRRGHRDRPHLRRPRGEGQRARAWPTSTPGTSAPPAGPTPTSSRCCRWVAADMFVEALKAAGPDPTQAKIVAHMKTVTKYTGGGIVAPINPAQKKQPTCFQILEVKGGKWVKQHPAKGFAC